jgi:hypothetical protein
MASLLSLTEPEILAFIFSIPETSNVKSDRAISKLQGFNIGNRVDCDISVYILGNEMQF